MRRLWGMKISPTMEAALVAIISAMPLVGDRSLALLPCGTRTAQALEDRKLIKATAVPTAERVRWSLTDAGMELANGLWLAALGCQCPTPNIAHDTTCPMAPPVQAAMVTWCHYCPPARIEPADMEALAPDGVIIPMCGGIMCREVSDDDGAVMYDVIDGAEIRERQAEIRAARTVALPETGADGAMVTAGCTQCDRPESEHCAQCPTCPVEGLACACPSEDTKGRLTPMWLLTAREDGGAESLGFASEANLRRALRVAGVPAGAVYPGRSGTCVVSGAVVSWYRVGEADPAERGPGSPVPTADGEAAMTGDPVAWFDGLTTIQVPTPVPGHMIDFSALLAGPPVYRVHGHDARDHHLVTRDAVSVVLRPLAGGLEWTYDASELYRVTDGTAITAGDVASLPTPREAVAAVVARLPWSARGRKRKINTGFRRQRRGN